MRRNIGRDFGGYRYGVLKILEDYNPERLLILNDSVFYRRNGLDQFVGEMLSDRDFVGVAENYEFQYHVGSYAISVSKKILDDKRFKEYWKKYKLTEVRPKVIKRGEMGLNKLIINRIGVKPHVIYSPHKLQTAIKNSDIGLLVDGYAAMPSRFMAGRKGDVISRLSSIAEKWNFCFDEEVLQFVYNDKLSIELTEGVLSNASRAKSASGLIGINKNDLMQRVLELNRVEIENELVEFAMQGSQIHWAGALLVRYLNCPLIKNDMVVRLIYSPAELQSFSKCMNPDEYEEFFYIQTCRGIPIIHWKGLKRAMLMLGYI